MQCAKNGNIKNGQHFLKNEKNLDKIIVSCSGKEIALILALLLKTQKLKMAAIFTRHLPQSISPSTYGR